MPPRRTRLAPGGRPKRKSRSVSEFARIYGSKARVAWVKSLPCVICGLTPSENAHIVTGGLSRKADACSVVPLCRLHHAEQHAFGIRTLQDDYGVDLWACAEATAKAWDAREGAA